jgi:purine-binding chemotaxis protein CheW
MSLFLLARIDGRGLAIDAAEVESVIDIGVVVPTPGAPETVVGIAALRSRVVTVVDTWAALGVTAMQRSPRAVVTRVEGHDYALLFDAVEDIASLELSPLANGMHLEGAWASAAQGMVEHEGEPMLAISLAGLVPHAAHA